MSNRETIQLKCKSCGGVMTPDENLETLFCPFCGSKELITDSDAVAVEKIKRDMEYKRWEHEDSQKEQAEQLEYKNSKAGKVAIVFSIICGIMSVTRFTHIHSFSNFLGAVLLLLQTILFLASFLVRKEVINPEKIIKIQINKLPTFLMAAGFFLFIPVFIFTAL